MGKPLLSLFSKSKGGEIYFETFYLEKCSSVFLTFFGAGQLPILLRSSTGRAAAAGPGLALPAALQAALGFPRGRVGHVSLCLLPEIISNHCLNCPVIHLIFH